MLYREIIAVCSEIRTEHINTVCGQIDLVQMCVCGVVWCVCVCVCVCVSMWFKGW